MIYEELPYRYLNAEIKRDDKTGWCEAIYDTAADFLRSYATYAAQGKAPMFVGTSGSGKTYAAAAIINKIRQHRNSSGDTELRFAWIPVGECFDQLMALRDFRDPTYWKLDYLLKNAEIAVFDDFAYLSEYPRLRELFWIYVNARYDRALPTIFTANLDLANLGWEAIDRMFGEAYRRRIQHMTEGLVAAV